MPRPRLPVLLPLLLLALPWTAAAADDEAQWAGEGRRVSATAQGGGFLLQSVRDSGLGADDLSAAYDPAAARLAITLAASEPAAARLGSALDLQAITEYQDRDGDGRLGPTDEVVRRVPLAGTPAVSSVEPVPGGGWRATVVHTLPASGLAAAPGRLEVEVVARGEPEAGRDPTRLDVTMRVLDGWAGIGSHLALEAALASDPAPTRASIGADAARVRDGDLVLATAWQDGRGTVVEGDDPSSATFVRSQPAGHVVSFPAAVSAGWRPAADASDGVVGNVAFYVGAAIVAAAAVVLPTWRRLRPA